jgi:hypothetical protein
MSGLIERLHGYLLPVLVNPDQRIALKNDDGPSRFEGSLAGISANSFQCIAELAVTKLGRVRILLSHSKIFQPLTYHNLLFSAMPKDIGRPQALCLY